MKHYHIESSIPNTVTNALRSHFKWTKTERLDDLIRFFIARNHGRNMIEFDLHHEIFSFVRQKITEKNNMWHK